MRAPAYQLDVVRHLDEYRIELIELGSPA
jgi:hypothetical protein